MEDIFKFIYKKEIDMGFNLLKEIKKNNKKFIINGWKISLITK